VWPKSRPIAYRRNQKLKKSPDRHDDNGRENADKVASAGRKEFNYYSSHSLEISRKYKGKHIAIVGNKIVASGKNAMTVWESARKLYPNRTPALAYIPKDDLLVLTI
jgi:hypothetical protein